MGAHPFEIGDWIGKEVIASQFFLFLGKAQGEAKKTFACYAIFSDDKARADYLNVALGV
jgi:hypothetical protein